MNEKLKEALKKIPGLRPTVLYIRNRIIDAKAISNFLQERRIKRGNGQIRVGFICQYLPAWSKVEEIYQMMKEDPRFDPVILCVPSGIAKSKLLEPTSLENDVYEHLITHGYPEAINTLVGENKWLDLKQQNFSYIFYPRPYNALMPRPYTSHEVSKYSKICIIMYSVSLTKDIMQITLNRDFMANAYLYFAEFPHIKAYNEERNRLPHHLNLQKTVSLGYPMMERLYKMRNEESQSWCFSKNDFRVIWTPRWTSDLAMGGTNFFKYYLRIIDFAEKHKDIDFLLRPHPLAFSHFIETGEMTAEEVSAYKSKCESMPNVSIDKEQRYEATLWQSSVMVSDISGIMPEFFFTGKPLIYCSSNMILEVSAPIKRMLEGCYTVECEQELFACLEMLKRGEDPLREKRNIIRDELFANWNAGICSNIVEILAEETKE